MSVKLDPTTVVPVNEATVIPATAPTSRPPARTSPTPTEEPASTSPPVPVQTTALEANVTFRRDAKGQIYYVLTDAQSGKEIREVPPAEIRKVSEGIQDYLKQEEAKTTTHVDSKA